MLRLTSSWMAYVMEVPSGESSVNRGSDPFAGGRERPGPERLGVGPQRGGEDAGADPAVGAAADRRVHVGPRGTGDQRPDETEHRDGGVCRRNQPAERRVGCD